MSKYELLKIEKGAFMDCVMEEFFSTNSWDQVLDFIESVSGSIESVGLYVRFNKLNYVDMNAGTIHAAAEESNCQLKRLSLKKLAAYCKKHDYRNWYKNKN